MDADSVFGSLDRLASTVGEQVEAFEARAEVQQRLTCSHDGDEFRSFSEARTDGLALRVWIDGGEGFANTHETSPAAIKRLVHDAIETAKAKARRGADRSPPQPATEGHDYEPKLACNPIEADPDAILSLLEKAREGALAEDEGAYARTSLASESRTVLFANHLGTRSKTGFTQTTLQAQCVHKDGPRLAEGTEWAAGERGLDEFQGDEAPEAIGRRAAKRGIEAAHAVEVPVGRQRVLCNPVLAGLLAHESFGHLTEYDLVGSGWSLLRDREGETFADPQVSVVDAPAVPWDETQGIRVPVDQEGTRGETVRILDEGQLSNWMHKRSTAEAAETSPTGNGRAYSIRHPPIVRMRNTYFEAGDHTLEEAIEALGDGVYLMDGRGGAPASDGTFTFTAVRGYKVEDGEITDPLRSTTISGHVLDFLDGIEALTKNVEVTTTNFGGCGKWGQSFLPVGMGGPHVLVDEAMVGGER